MGLIDDQFGKNRATAPLDALFTWVRPSWLSSLQCGLARCGMEMISAPMSRCDMSERFGNLQWASPRQAALMIVTGTVPMKMAPISPPRRRQHARRPTEVGGVDVLVVHKLDRFARNVLVTLQTLHRMEGAGVAFVNISANMDFVSPIGKVILALSPNRSSGSCP